MFYKANINKIFFFYFLNFILLSDNFIHVYNVFGYFSLFVSFSQPYFLPHTLFFWTICLCPDPISAWLVHPGEGLGLPSLPSMFDEIVIVTILHP